MFGNRPTLEVKFPIVKETWVGRKIAKIARKYREGWGMKIADQYRKRTGEQDAHMANTGMQSYVAMMFLKDAIERVGSVDREKVREALPKTNLTPDKGNLTL